MIPWCYGVSNHWQIDYLFNSLFSLARTASKLHTMGPLQRFKIIDFLMGAWDPWTMIMVPEHREWVPSLIFLYIGKFRIRPQDAGGWWGVADESLLRCNGYMTQNAAIAESLPLCGEWIPSTKSQLFWKVLPCHATFMHISTGVTVFFCNGANEFQQDGISYGDGKLPFW